MSGKKKHPAIQIRAPRGHDKDEDENEDQAADGHDNTLVAHGRRHPHLNIPATSVLQLILAHLTEHGLHESVQALQRECRVGMAASFISDWSHLATTGQWDVILSALAALDDDAYVIPDDATTLRWTIHEHVILELADEGEWETAYALFRIFQQSQQQQQQLPSLEKRSKNKTTTTTTRISVDAKLADLAARRAKDPRCSVTDDYYYYQYDEGNGDDDAHHHHGSNKKEQCRQWIGRQLQRTIPKQPPDRLVSLLQQSIKWQSYTGQLLPSTMGDGKVFDLVLGQVEGGAVVPVGQDGHHQATKKKMKLVKKEGVTIKFGKHAVCESAAFLTDGSALVTGSSDGLVEVWDVHTGQPLARHASKSVVDGVTGAEEEEEEEVVMAHDTAVTAVAVSNDTTLIATGGSDGKVNVWRTDSGKLLRHLDNAKAYVSYLAFHPAGDRVLVAGQDGSCREYGLRGARMLQEFSTTSTSGDAGGGASFLTQCLYVPLPSSVMNEPITTTTKHHHQQQHKRKHYGDEDDCLFVLTAHGDGTVCLWDATSAAVVLVLQPVMFAGTASGGGSSTDQRRRLPGIGSSLVAADQAVATGSSIVSLHCLHTPLHSVLIVARHVRAFLCDARGTVLRVFDVPVDSAKAATVAATARGVVPAPPRPAVMVVATVSACNRWFYAATDDGACHVFDVTTGDLERSLPNFGACSTSSSSSSNRDNDDATNTISTTMPRARAPPELTSIIYHPHSDLIAAFSNDKSQRKGKLVLWR